VSVKLREEADRCFRSLDCPSMLKTEKETQCLQSLLGRLVGLKFLTLRSLKAVSAAFNEDGSHACGPRLVDLVIDLEKVSSSPALHVCMHGLYVRAHAVWASCTLLSFPLCYPQTEVCRMTQDQFASVCQRTSSWLLELFACSFHARGKAKVMIHDLAPLAPCSLLTALHLNDHIGIQDLTPLSGLTRLSELRLGWCKTIRSVEPLQSLVRLSSLDLSNTQTHSLEPLTSLWRLTELDLSFCYELASLDPLGSLIRLRRLRLSYARAPSSPSFEFLSSLILLEELELRAMSHLASLEPLLHHCQLWRLVLGRCSDLTSLDPLATLPWLMDLDISECESLPPTALVPLCVSTSLRLLNVMGCPPLDLAPLALCRDLRRLYTSIHSGLDFKPLKGLMPRLVVKSAKHRTEDLDARLL
jgi:Leucine-rich repeat (LRR) protein